MDIKFTSDGRKVAVVGKLNNLETIVQEVFVMEGNEIPSGENFVVKSLHDAPAVSWKEKNLNDLEIRYHKEQKEWDVKIETLNKHFRKVSSDLEERYRWAAKAVKEIDENVFELLAKFLSGRIHFVVSVGYCGMEIKTFDSEIGGTNDNYHSFDRDLKLMTFFGKNDKTFNVGINRYSDGSGSYSTHSPFETEKEALQYVHDWINSDKLTTCKVNAAKKYNLTIDPKQMDEYKKEQIENIIKSIEAEHKTIEKHNKKIEEINQMG